MRSYENLMCVRFDEGNMGCMHVLTPNSEATLVNRMFLNSVTFSNNIFFGTPNLNTFFLFML